MIGSLSPKIRRLGAKKEPGRVALELPRDPVEALNQLARLLGEADELRQTLDGEVADRAGALLYDGVDACDRGGGAGQSGLELGGDGGRSAATCSTATFSRSADCRTSAVAGPTSSSTIRSA